MKTLGWNCLVVIALMSGLNAAAQPPIAGYTQHDLAARPPDATGLALMRQVQSDIARAEKDATPYPGDHYRFATARGEVDRIQQTWQDGSYTRNQLNDAISHLQLVLNTNRLSPGDRALLSADLERLRDFRVEHFY